jgi:NitT/TauT family transport system substrate-binding protein
VGRRTVLATSRNVLIVADILIVNKGFAQQQPAMVAGLVNGLLEGNRMVREDASACYPVIMRAFKWDNAKTRAELGKVHFSNLR